MLSREESRLLVVRDWPHIGLHIDPVEQDHQISIQLSVKDGK